MNVMFFIPRFASGGAEAFIVNVCEQMILSGHNCSIVCIDSKESVYESKINKLGIPFDTLVEDCQVSAIALYIKGFFAFRRYLQDNAKGIDVIHFNIAQGEELPFIWAAKNALVPVRVLHSHNSSVNSKPKLVGHKLCMSLFKDVATDYLACSDKAAEWLIPKNVLDTKAYSIIKNGIKVSRFTFDENIRGQKRAELGIGSDPLVLIVGRLETQKNHSFLLDVMRLLVDSNSQLHLACVGDGPLKCSLTSKVRELGLSRNVMWLGVRNDIPALLSAADCFVLPSLYEGFPFSLIEAQSEGLRCVVADTISSQCALTDLLTYCPLDASVFACGIRAVLGADNSDRSHYANTVYEAGYDIESTVDSLMNIYMGNAVNEKAY